MKKFFSAVEGDVCTQISFQFKLMPKVIFNVGNSQSESAVDSAVPPQIAPLRKDVCYLHGDEWTTFRPQDSAAV